MSLDFMERPADGPATGALFLHHGRGSWEGDLLPLADLPARVLSAGQKRRLAIARVLARVHAPIWILDEPTNGLDTEARKRLFRALAAHRQGGGLVIAASHETLDLPEAAILDLRPFAESARVVEVRGLEVDQVI